MEDFKNIEQKLTKLSQAERKRGLRENDKQVLRNELETYTKEYVHVTEQDSVRDNGLRVLKGTLVGLLGIMIAGGTAAYAAGDALPGQSLYSVKVNFNEKMRSLAAVSDEAEARLQAQLAERRIEEAGKLAAQGQLSREEEQDLQARFEQHSAASEASLNKIEGAKRNETVAEIQSEFEATVTAHENLLAQLAQEKRGSGDEQNTSASVSMRMSDTSRSNASSSQETEASSESAASSTQNMREAQVSSAPEEKNSSKMQATGVSQSSSDENQAVKKENSVADLSLPENKNSAGVNDILNWLHSEREKLSEKRGNTEEKLWTEVSSRVDELTEKTRKLAETRLRSAKESFRKNKESLSPSVQDEVERHINVAAKDIEQGVDSLDEEQYAEGYQTLRTAMRRALQAQALIRTSLEFDSYTKLEDITTDDLKANVQEVVEEDKTQNIPDVETATGVLKTQNTQEDSQ